MYNMSFQLTEQKGSFQGIDTIDVCNFGDFSFCSHLTHMNECVSISNRPDINSLLQRLYECKMIHEDTVSSMRDEAREYKR